MRKRCFVPRIIGTAFNKGYTEQPLGTDIHIMTSAVSMYHSDYTTKDIPNNPWGQIYISWHQQSVCITATIQQRIYRTTLGDRYTYHDISSQYVSQRLYNKGYTEQPLGTDIHIMTSAVSMYHSDYTTKDIPNNPWGQIYISWHQQSVCITATIQQRIYRTTLGDRYTYHDISSQYVSQRLDNKGYTEQPLGTDIHIMTSAVSMYHSDYTIVCWSIFGKAILNELVCKSLQWRHNERDGVSNHRRSDCLRNRLFRRRSTKRAPRHWPLWWEFTGDRWFPRTKGK